MDRPYNEQWSHDHRVAWQFLYFRSAPFCLQLQVPPESSPGQSPRYGQALAGPDSKPSSKIGQSVAMKVMRREG